MLVGSARNGRCQRIYMGNGELILRDQQLVCANIYIIHIPFAKYGERIQKQAARVVNAVIYMCPTFQR